MTNHEAAKEILARAKVNDGLWMGHDFIPQTVLEEAIARYLEKETERLLEGTDRPSFIKGIFG